MGPESRLILPVKSVAFSRAYSPWLTHRMRFAAVEAGSNSSPVSMRCTPPLPACTLVITCGEESVPSGLMLNR